MAERVMVSVQRTDEVSRAFRHVAELLGKGEYEEARQWADLYAFVYRPIRPEDKRGIISRSRSRANALANAARSRNKRDAVRAITSTTEKLLKTIVIEADVDPKTAAKYAVKRKVRGEGKNNLPAPLSGSPS